MKHSLGISVYPDISPIEDIKKYIELASKYGFKKIFSSMFSVNWICTSTWYDCRPWC